MNSTAITITVTALVVVVIVYRNVTWQSVKLSKLTRLPVVFAVVGGLVLATTVRSLGAGWRPARVDLVVLGAELLLAVVVGWAMGRLSEFRTANGSVQTRLRPVGVVAFLGFIAGRILGAFVDTELGGTAPLMSASVLLVIAVIKLTQGLVVREGLAAHTATSSSAPVVVPQPSAR